MATTMKQKANSDDRDFRWGDILSQDMPGQLTRSMLEMRTPKAYELKELPPLPVHDYESKASGDIHVPVCPIVQHSVQLQKYIKQAESLVSSLEGKLYASYAHAQRIAELSKPPPFQPRQHLSTDDETPAFASKGTGNVRNAFFVAPQPSKAFRAGKTDISLSQISDDTATTALKKSVQAIAAQAGYEESNTTCLNVLVGVTRNFMKSFSKCMRDALDRESETGCPPFYDVLVEVLNDSGVKSLKELELFWNSAIVGRHTKLQKRALTVSKEVQALKFRIGEDTDTTQLPQNKIGKWTPVAGMRSGPDSGRKRSDVPVAGQSIRTIKAEFPDYRHMEMPDAFIETKPPQDTLFEFDDNPNDGMFGLGQFDYMQVPNKKSRNGI